MMSNNIFTRPEKVISGVCSRLALKYNIKPWILRILFIYFGLTFYFIFFPFYFYLALSKGSRIYPIIGAVLGIPLSYYFQPSIVQNLLGISQYMGRLDKIFKEVEFAVNIMNSILLFALIGCLIGYIVDKNEAKKVI